MNWGLIGYGKIARKFIASLLSCPDQNLHAIATRTNADRANEEHGAKVLIYNSYEKLLADPEIDIVYINTAHNFHKRNTEDALKAGKHVLCEKPMGINFSEVKEMVSIARNKGLFLMEAMWTRFLPAYREMKNILDSGIIGMPRLIQANFAFRASDQSVTSRLFNPDLAGGSLLDVGIYPLSLALDVFNEVPISFSASAELNPLKVDKSCSISLRFRDNRTAQLFSSISIDTHHDAIIAGTNGWLKFKDFWHGTQIIVTIDRKERKILKPFDQNGYVHEIRACKNAIMNGRIEHPLMTHEDSLRISKLMDDILCSINYRS